MDESRFELDIVICPEGVGKNKIYSINSIQVPNVVTQGKTIEEAKKRLREALNLYFEDMSGQKEQIRLACQREAPMISRIFL
jgi:predicted RNase H-like HicB family nuclease